jgi:SAM-dependent methyltransferase
LRRAELARVRRWFVPGQRVLELGGGSGYQASLLAAWGCRVVSLDLPGRPPAGESYYPIRDYDGQNVPFAAGTFDRVFSSNVLEHVRGLPALLAETRRVLKPGGLGVHLMPTPGWRLWTSVAHYGYLAKCLLGGDRAIPGVARAKTAGDVLAARGAGYLLRRALFAGPHGEWPNAAAELYGFSRRRWTRVFETNGFGIVQVADNGVFYTGYGLFPGRSLAARRRLARWLGPACHVFVVQPS